MYIRRSEDILDVIWKSYLSLIYLLCPGGRLPVIQKEYTIYLQKIKFCYLQEFTVRDRVI